MNGNVKVWDIFVRFFHWAVVALLAVVFLAEEDFLTLHAAAGYVILFLIAGRALWGFIGTPHARFSDFVRPFRQVADYVKAAVRFRHPRTLGHNPLAGVMMLAMLLFAALACITGVAVYGAEEHAGPLAGVMAAHGWKYAGAIREVHAFFAWGLVALAGLHAVAAIVESWHFKENLVAAMFTGYKSETTALRRSHE